MADTKTLLRETKRKRIRKINWDLLFYIGLVSIPVLQFLIFYVGVRFNSLLMAFQTYGGDGQFYFSGLSTFKTLFDDLIHVANYRIAFLNAGLVWLLGTLINTPLCLLISYVIYKKIFMGRFFKVVMFVPSILSTMVTVMLYENFCESAIPSLFDTLFHIQIRPLISNPATRFGTIFVYGIWCGYGASLLLYVNAMDSISHSVTEAAQLDGASFTQEFIYVTLPQIYPVFAIQLILSLTGIFANQFYLYEFFGLSAEGDIQTIGYYMFAQVFLKGERVYPSLTALGLLLTVVTVPVVLLLRRFSEKLNPMN